MGISRTLAFALCLAAGGGVQAQSGGVLGTGALPGEKVVLPGLRGILTVPDAAGAALPVPAGFSGVDASRTPLVRDPGAEEVLRAFIGEPASLASLDRIAIGLRTWLRGSGHPFATAYVPPQDVTEGVVRVVVQRARLEGDLKVEGARHFPEAAYRAALPVRPGEEIEAQALADGIARLNENPFRRATLVAEPGDSPGSTRLALRAQDERPWRFTLGYANTGTRLTKEDRLSASVLWGDAFGRGDQLSYSFTADPGLQHSRQHAVSYLTVLPSLGSLSFYGSHAEVESILPQPLVQRGKSWQLGMRHSMSLGSGVWKQALALSADFKYADNTLEFAAIPVTNNETNIVQFGARWSGLRQGEDLSASLGAALYASPGGITDRNTDAAFNASRAGAKANYAYGRLDGRLVGALPRGFSWSVAGTLQRASGPLLGTEQMSGGGAGAVRGYREASAFGDQGVLVNSELRFPSLAGEEARADPFVFYDVASLRDRGSTAGSTRLASVGAGLNVAAGSMFSASLRVGRQLKGIASSGFERDTRAHLSIAVNF